MTRLTRAELVELVRQIRSPDITFDEEVRLIEQLHEGMDYPTKVPVWNLDLSPEEAVDRGLNYKPLQLGGG